MSKSNDPLRFVPSVTRSRYSVFSLPHPKGRRFERNWVLISRLLGHLDIETEKGPTGPVFRTASFGLPTHGMIRTVFVAVLIDIRFVPRGWAVGSWDGEKCWP